MIKKKTLPILILILVSIGVVIFALGFLWHIMRDLNCIPQRGIHRAILPLADLNRLADFVRVNAFARHLIMDMDFAKPPGRIIVLHRLRRDVELVQFLTLFLQDLHHIIRRASDQRHGQ
jgi:hypothetical protein